MYQPTLEQVEKLSLQGNLIPVYKDVSADLETPVSAYLKIMKPPYSFLLESVEGADRIARYSFIGTEPSKIIKTGPGQQDGPIDPLIPVQEALAGIRTAGPSPNQRFNGGAVGFLSYETIRYFEKLGSPEHNPFDIPESIFMITDTFMIFDHLLHKIRVVSHAYVEQNVEQGYIEAIARIDSLIDRLSSTVTEPIYSGPTLDDNSRRTESNMTKKQYQEIVNKVKEYVRAGDVIQTVVSQRLQRPIDTHPFQIYRALRAINPSPYMYYLELEDFHILGASPELLVQVEDGKVATHPIAGTLPRSTNPIRDAALENKLRTDEKELAEHIMLVDLGRNDIGRVSKPGTVEVTQLMDVERYSHVMHLVSHVTGKLRDEFTAYDVLRACFPAGTVSGAPKIRAMEIISELEPDKRGPYAGAIGYFDFTGNMDTAITIRTLVVKDGIAYTQAGGGIVFDSKPDSEYQETLDKASAVLKAIEQAELNR